MEGSRSYTIVVLFTAIELKSQCFACAHVQEAFQKTAYSYRQNGANLPGEADGKKIKPVFFAVVDYTRATAEIIQKFGFTNLPNLLVSSKSVSEAGGHYTVSSGRMWELRGEEYPSAEDVLGFVNRLCERKIDFYYSFLDAATPHLVRGIMVVLVVWILWKVVKNMFKPMLWWTFGMIVYVVCMGGVVYDIVHGAHLAGYTKEGETMYFASGPRNQYILEGFFMSTLISLGGCALILINTAAKFESKWAIRFVAYISIGVWVFCAYQTTNLYKEKVSWYSPTFAPPSNYIKGPLIADQGNSF